MTEISSPALSLTNEYSDSKRVTKANVAIDPKVTPPIAKGLLILGKNYIDRLQCICKKHLTELKNMPAERAVQPNRLTTFK